jgi:shikimate kinase
LIGFMGAGKTSVGKRLAAELKLPFIDTDDAVVSVHGPIPAIFEREGEAGFRARELAAVAAALDGEPAVLALGGGAVTHDPTRALLADGRALRVFLDVPFEVMFSRLRYSNGVRPMLVHASGEAGARALYERRLERYREADVVVDCGRRSSSAVAKHLAALLRERGPQPAA